MPEEWIVRQVSEWSCRRASGEEPGIVLVWRRGVNIPVCEPDAQVVGKQEGLPHDTPRGTSCRMLREIKDPSRHGADYPGGATWAGRAPAWATRTPAGRWGP